MAGYERTIWAPDGTRIAYTVEGTGPALVLTNGLTTTAHFWKYLRPHWVDRHTVITWDLPGHGRSAPARSEAGAKIESLPAALARILDDLAISRATHIGWSVGCQVVLEFYRQHPERCQALVTLFGPAQRALSNTRLPFITGSLMYRLLRDPRTGVGYAKFIRSFVRGGMLPGAPAVVRKLGLIGEGTSNADLRQLIADIQRVDSVTGRIMACSAEEHSALDVLGKLRVPLLIVAGDKDLFAPAEQVGAPMHRAAPGSVFVRFEDATHSALLDHHEQLAPLIDDFLASCRAPAPALRGVS